MKLRAALLIALLAACSSNAGREATAPGAATDGTATGGQATDGGPIRPTSYVEAAYERFLGKRDPMVFALSEDGRAAFYKFCRTSGYCDEYRARADALSGCEDKARGVPCRIYYEAPNGVVWDGPPVLGLDTPPTPE